VQTAAFPGIRARALFFRDPEGNVVEVPSTVEWDRGGHSLYFRDPDGHLLELAGPGLWDFY
jgi:catechol 2,3-dioxygenase-like lactoylglutathione lyase family enzyme